MMYDKAEAKWIETHASNAAVRSDFYTVDLLNEGASDEVERALGVIEGRMMSAVRTIDEGEWPPTEEGRQALADFIGLQSVRGTDFRDFIQASYDQVGQKLADVIAATGAGLRRAFVEVHGRVPKDEELEEVRKGMAGVEVRADIPRNYQVVVMLQMAGEQALIVYQKQLHVLEAKDAAVFVTADIPVALWSQTRGPFWGTSVMMADEVHLPLDRRRCLLLNHPSSEKERGTETITMADAARVAELNSRIFTQAHRFVFCHPDDVAVLNELGAEI